MLSFSVRFGTSKTESRKDPRNISKTYRRKLRPKQRRSKILARR